MLTKDDLKQLRTVIREEMESEAETTRHHIDEKQRELRMELKPEIREIKDRVKTLNIEATKNHKEVLGKLEKTSDFLDRTNLTTLKRVERIETHLGLSPD